MKVMQVYFNEKLVGALENPPCRPEEAPAEIAILAQSARTQKWGVDVNEMSDMIWVSTSQRFLQINQEELEDLGMKGLIPGSVRDPAFMNRGPLARAFGVPGYANMNRMPQDMSIRFDWRVIAPTLDQYEILFDLDDFKPL